MKLCLVLLVVLMLALAACVAPAAGTPSTSIEVLEPWVRAVGGMEGMGNSSATALFMNIENHAETADTLLRAESDVAEMVQIHLSEIDANGVSSMHEVDGVEIPAGGIAELKPGGYHVMLMGLKREIMEGESISFTLTFRNAGEVTIEAPVKAP